MKILTLNCGSSSIKFEVIDTCESLMETKCDLSVVKGIVEKIGLKDSIIKFEYNGEKSKKTQDVKDHSEALNHIVEILRGKSPQILENLDEIKGIGHRMVHGAEAFYKSTLINPEVEKKLDECCKFAPLHNPQNIKGYNVAKEFFPNVPHVAVFDTGFHHTIPDYAYMYPLPYEMYEKHGIRRYGFHGSSHRFVSERASELLGKPIHELKIITCHLGNGSSVTAIDKGKSVDTSMGFTPLEGLMMGTRCGDLDPAVVLLGMKDLNLSQKEMDDLLNKKSGFLGVTQLSSDLREVEEEYLKGNKLCSLALHMASYRLRKYIGAYMAALGGADAIVFTGGIGERSPIVRGLTIQNLEFAGVELEQEANEKSWGIESVISKGESKVKVFVIPTNEELVIARDTFLCIEGKL